MLSAAARHTLGAFGELLGDPATGYGPYESLERIASLYRKFAKQSPRTYAMIVSDSLAVRADLLSARQATAELELAWFTLAIGKDAALSATRMLVPYLHGFLSMGLAKAFRSGGDEDTAFQYGLTKRWILCSEKRRLVPKKYLV